MSTRKIVFTLLMFACVHPTAAQFTDNFSDGDFQTNPTWQGNDSRFLVNGGRLKLQAPATNGTAFLSTSSEAIHAGTWSFDVQMDFTPSSSNYVKIFLVSDQPDPTASLNGYFVKIGNTSREVSLYKQSGTTEVELIDGLDDRVNQLVVSISVRVTRDANGNWELYTDAGKTGNWQKEGTTQDNTHTRSTWFAIECIYTSTRSDKFWFDDFVVSGTKIPDTTPPSIAKIDVLDSIRFEVQFSEPILPASVNRSAVDVEEIGSPTTVELKADQVTVACTLASALVNGRTYVVRFTDLSDVVGNVMSPTAESLLFFRPGLAKWKSVLITEFLPDPTPQVKLPAVEFVELFNRSPIPFDLTNWSLSDGASVGKFPKDILLPGEYRIVTSSSSTGAFNDSNTIGLTNFPSLNNAGDRLLLYDASGELIDSLQYTLDWYRDEDKQQGGWSLELIDPSNPCGEMDNWSASESTMGGTPGKENSVKASKPDLTGPVMSEVQVASPQTLWLEFSESLNPSSLNDAVFALDPPLGFSKTSIPDAGRRRVQLELAGELKQRTKYILRVEGVSDCNNNLMKPTEMPLGLPEPADSLDLILSEILFNPRPGGVDFVEIYNASTKFIQLSGARLYNESSEVRLLPRMIFPGQRIAITADPVVVRLQYPSPEDAIILKSNLPSLPDDEGMISLKSMEGNVLDVIHYDRAWHSPLIKNDEGVSLERIDAHAPTQQATNWISASSRAGFATPGLPNSQERGAVDQENEDVVVLPEIFSPGAQQGDFVRIHYQFEDSGRIASIQVFNFQGQLVRRIGDNELLGTEGFFRWDGDRDEGTKAVAGYYVIWFETFDKEGRVNKYIKRVVVTGR